MSVSIACVSTLEIADKVFDRAAALHAFSHYTGTVTLHGMARRCELDKSGKKLEEFKKLLYPYITRGVRYGNFESYHCGGNGVAWLLYRGLLPECEKVVRRCADQLCRFHPRTKEGIFSHPNPEKAKMGKFWIDTAFAVCPFLLFAGLYCRNEKWIEEAYRQIKLPYDLLYDEEYGLLHQSRGFCGPGCFSQDHWSRGNGWGILALTELAAYFPRESEYCADILRMYTDLVDASIKFQDSNGMWHQEMTRPDSFVETSGTGLLLYAIGAGIENGLDRHGWREAFRKGLNGYLSYIAVDGSVHHTCRGCLSPGKGTIEDYMMMEYPVNDAHAHGPVVLAFSQAQRVGIESLSV